NIVYWLSGNVTVPTGKTLTIAAGQIVKAPYGNENILVNGTLRATGTVAQPVIFTSYRDDSAGGDTDNSGATNGINGDWAAIQFTATSTNNLLDHAEVRYGGGWGPKAEVVDVGGALTITNSVLRNSYTVGLRVEGASPTLTNLSWSNNNSAAMSMDLAA